MDEISAPEWSQQNHKDYLEHSVLALWAQLDRSQREHMLPILASKVLLMGQGVGDGVMLRGSVAPSQSLPTF